MIQKTSAIIAQAVGEHKREAPSSKRFALSLANVDHLLAELEASANQNECATLPATNPPASQAETKHKRAFSASGDQFLGVSALLELKASATREDKKKESVPDPRKEPQMEVGAKLHSSPWRALVLSPQTKAEGAALTIVVQHVGALLSCVRAPQTKLAALELFGFFAPLLDDHTRLDRLLPYCVSLLDPRENAAVQATAVATLAQVLSLTQSLSADDEHIFLGYVLPSLAPLSTFRQAQEGAPGGNPSPSASNYTNQGNYNGQPAPPDSKHNLKRDLEPPPIARLAFARSLALLAETSQRFLELASSHAHHITEPGDDGVSAGPAGLLAEDDVHSAELKGAAGVGIRVALRGSLSSYDSHLVELKNKFLAILIELLTYAGPRVQRALLQVRGTLPKHPSFT
jgi:hypothetical protein